MDELGHAVDVVVRVQPTHLAHRGQMETGLRPTLDRRARLRLFDHLPRQLGPMARRTGECDRVISVLRYPAAVCGHGRVIAVQSHAMDGAVGDARHAERCGEGSEKGDGQAKLRDRGHGEFSGRNQGAISLVG
jgi:hypothetical protein